METIIHGINKIELGKLETNTNTDNRTYYTRELIIKSDKETLEVSLFSDNKEGLEINLKA